MLLQICNGTKNTAIGEISDYNLWFDKIFFWGGSSSIIVSGTIWLRLIFHLYCLTSRKNIWVWHVWFHYCTAYPSIVYLFPQFTPACFEVNGMTEIQSNTRTSSNVLTVFGNSMMSGMRQHCIMARYSTGLVGHAPCSRPPTHLGHCTTCDNIAATSS